MRKNKKIPSKAIDSSYKKEVRVGQGIPASYDSFEPSWKFSLIDLDGPWGWNNISSDNRWEILFNKVNLKEHANWAMLKSSGSHNVSIDKLNKKAKARLIEIGHDDIDELFSLRVSGKERIWGIRDRYALKIIWWDPKHEVCPSLKKHT